MTEPSLEELRSEIRRAEAEVAEASAIVEALDQELAHMPDSVGEIEQRLARVRASSIRFLVAGVAVLLMWIAGYFWWTYEQRATEEASACPRPERSPIIAG